MSVKEYSLKFIKLSMYASFSVVKFNKLSMYSSSLVINNRDEMSRFVSGVSKDLMEDCLEAMFHEVMDLGRLMVHPQQVEESRKRRHSKEGNRSRKAVENFSKKSST